MGGELRLESWWVPDGGAGAMRLRLVNAGRTEIEEGFELTFTTVVQLEPAAPAVLVRRTSGCHVVAAPAGTTVPPGGTWEFVATCGHRPAHANDGPESAYLTAADGSIRAVRTGATARLQVRRPEAPTYRAAEPTAAWAAVEARERRLHPGAAPALSPTGEHLVHLDIDSSFGPDEHVVGADLHLTAGSEVAMQRAISELVRAGAPPRTTRHSRATSGAGCTSTSPGSSSPPPTSPG